MTKTQKLIAGLLLVAAAGCSRGENLMLKVKAPDARLNDGKFAAKFPINAEEETFSQFGWTPFIWNIDLGEEKAINSIRLFSDRPDHPMDAILVLGSCDNNFWFKITDLAEDDHLIKMDNGRLIYADSDIRSNVRYLRFALITRRLPETWFFDELEVNGDSDLWASAKLTDTAVESAQDAINDALTAVGARQRLMQDCDKVRELAADHPAIIHKLDQLQQQIMMMSPAEAEGFSTVFPQNGIHRDIFAAFAETLRAEGEAELVISNPYRYIFPEPFGKLQGGFQETSFNMLQNERRSELFEIRSIAENDVVLASRFTGDPEILAALELAELPWTDTAEGIPVSTILLPESLDSSIALIPGLTKRFWLSVNSEELAPGSYQVLWELGENTYPININISKIMLNEPRLLVGTWDYTDTPPALGLNSGNVASAIAMMDKMRINMPWCSGLPMWKQSDFDKDGNLTAELDTEVFDRWLASRPGKPVYAVHVNVHGVKTVDGIPCGSPEFHIRTLNWIKAWDRHLQDLGLKPGQVQWLMVDEVTNKDKAAELVMWAGIFREAETKVLRQWEDPLVDIKAPEYAEMIELIDSICPGRDVYYVKSDYEFLQKLRESGKELYSYNCNGPSRLFDPFSYYKMHGLGAWHDKTTGIGFWSFGDCGKATAFNEYLLTWAIFTPACIDTDKVYSTLALEAIREGAEDHELIKMLEERMPQMSENKRAEAQNLLDGLFEYIEANTQIHIKWYNAESELDRTGADRFRSEIIGLLEDN